MSREDEDVARVVSNQFASEGIELLTNHLVTGFEKDEQGHVAVLKTGDDEVRVRFDALLVATGRKANTAIEGLDVLEIELNRNGTLVVDEYLRTRFPNIYACGDVISPYQFTHTAAHEAWYASVNALFGRLRQFRADYSVIPWATFTDPEVATVGLNELAAKEAGVEYELTRYELDDLDRAIADGETRGFVKVLTVPGKDKILGVTIVGYHAGTIISEFVLAMKQGIGLNKILGTIHIYPTLTEANKFAAGNWKRAHASKKMLAFSEWLHRRERR
jgi:pyruvate/2-oxoglutarate dehydrogenase complex dihydrolipoamide dehydrogenase (E3) component